jgi:hypothetical protein
MKGWLPFHEAVAYLTAIGLADAERLLSEAVDREQIRSQGRADQRIGEGITSADLAFDPNLQGEVLASELRGWAKAIGSGKSYWPDMGSDGSPKPSRVLTKGEREIARQTMVECRERDATNEEEEAAVAKSVGRPVRREDIRSLRGELGHKGSGRKPQ